MILDLSHQQARKVVQLLSQYEQSTYLDYLRAIKRFLIIVQGASQITLELLLSWLRLEWDAGRSPSTCVKGLTLLDYIGIVVNPLWQPVMNTFSIKKTLGAWQNTWEKKDRAPRQFISWTQALLLADHPPKGVQHVHWKAYILISWAFLLRHGEIRRVTPEDVSFFKEGACWEVNLGSCKTAKGKERYQTARMPLQLLPPQVCEALEVFSLLNNKNFSWRIPKGKVCAHLRQVLSTEDKGFVFHSLRHGRATHLRRVHQLKDDELKVLGRWASVGGLYAYLHC